MNKTMAVRWLSVVVLGAVAIGCGNRQDHAAHGTQALAPVACVPPPVDTTKAPAAAPQVLAAPAPSTVAAAPKAAEKAEKAGAKSAKTDAGTKLKVRRLVVAESIERKTREPVGAKASFKATDSDKIYAFVEVENPSKAESEVFVTFEPQDAGVAQGQVTLKVGEAARWRTWAYTRGAKKAGSWAAVVRSADGTVLAKTPFDVTL